MRRKKTSCNDKISKQIIADCTPEFEVVVSLSGTALTLNKHCQNRKESTAMNRTVRMKPDVTLLNDNGRIKVL